MLVSRRYQAGTVHYLDFDEFNPRGPEMVKGRAVVIVNPKSRRHSDLVIVIPFSKQAPETHKKHAVRVIHPELNGENGGSWAKCDMPITVATSRLQDYRRPKYAGQNDVPAIQISGEELRRVREALFRVIGGKEMLARERLAHQATVTAQRPNTTSPKPVAKPKTPVAERRPGRRNRPIRKKV